MAGSAYMWSAGKVTAHMASNELTGDGFTKNG